MGKHLPSIIGSKFHMAGSSCTGHQGHFQFFQRTRVTVTEESFPLSTMVWLLLIHWKVLVFIVMAEDGKLFRRGVCWTSRAEYRKSGSIGTVSLPHGTEKRPFWELYWNQGHRADDPKQWTALHILLSKFRLPWGFHCRHLEWTNAP